jgi:hypothetical protein
MKIDPDKVPSNVEEAINMFLNALTDEEKQALKGIEEDQVALFHHTWGTLIRNEWSMWEKNTLLTNSFKQIGISHPDDMSGIILTSVHRKLNKKAAKLKDQIVKYQNYWFSEIGRTMP